MTVVQAKERAKIQEWLVLSFATKAVTIAAFVPDHHESFRDYFGLKA